MTLMPIFLHPGEDRRDLKVIILFIYNINLTMYIKLWIGKFCKVDQRMNFPKSAR